MEKMRRKKRQVTDLAVIKQFIREMTVVRLAFYDEDYPYLVPVNFGHTWEDEDLILYIHGANEGKKMRLLAANSHVAVELDGHHRLIPGKEAASFSYGYQSLIGKGNAEVVTELVEKRRGLALLMEQVAPGYEAPALSEQMLQRTAVIKIRVADYQMKQNPAPLKENNR